MHGGSILALRRHATGGDVPALANCELCRVRFAAGAFVVE